MVGPWPLSPHHDHLQYIYTSYTSNVTGSKPGHYTADFQGELGWNDDAATFEMNIVTGDYGIGGEYQLTNGLGPDKARQVMNVG